MGGGGGRTEGGSRGTSRSDRLGESPDVHGSTAGGLSLPVIPMRYPAAPDLLLSSQVPDLGLPSRTSYRPVAYPQVQSLLAREGYPVDQGLEEMLDTLQLRLSCDNFPHEIGLFWAILQRMWRAFGCIRDETISCADAGRYTPTWKGATVLPPVRTVPCSFVPTGEGG